MGEDHFQKNSWLNHPRLVLSILASAEEERERERARLVESTFWGTVREKYWGENRKGKFVLMLFRGRAESEFGFRVLLSVTPD